MLQGQILHARQYAISFLSGTKNGKNGLGAMTSARQNSRYRMKKKKKNCSVFSFFLTCRNIFFFFTIFKSFVEYHVAAEFSTNFHSEKCRQWKIISFSLTMDCSQRRLYSFLDRNSGNVTIMRVHSFIQGIFTVEHLGHYIKPFGDTRIHLK